MARETLPALKKLLLYEMELLLHAEQQLVKALPRLAAAAHAPRLRQILADHREGARGDVERLQQAFALLGAKPKPRPAPGMEGLLEEWEERAQAGAELESASTDLALIAAGRKAKHYELSGYGSLHALAERLGAADAAQLFLATIVEEQRVDGLLSEVSQSLFAKAA